MSKGYVAILDDPIEKSTVCDFVDIWLEQFDRVEQVSPGPNSNSTLNLKSHEDLLWEDSMQFRVMADAHFSWIYLTLDRQVIETSGIEDPDNLIPLEVLAELSGIHEVVDQKNDRRLDELEARGYL